MMLVRSKAALVLMFAVNSVAAPGFQSAVQARIEFTHPESKNVVTRPAVGEVVLWLKRLTANGQAESVAPGHFRIEQKNKSFSPHLLVVPLGSTVEFPNRDPFFHNVFSQFNGKRFDLGLYEAGSTKSVRFDHEGVSYIFCNIHSQMAAVILTLTTPYFSVANGGGVMELHDVPPGDYEMHIWAEGADAKQLESLTRRVHVGASLNDIGTIDLLVPLTPPAHKDKFGEDYKVDHSPDYR